MKKLSLEEQKRRLVIILDFFCEYCYTHNLKYSLDGGTMLGAVRHQGFIPWDDDIDVIMPRSDYETFKKLFKTEQSPYFKLHCYDIDGYLHAYMKLSDERTYIEEEGNSNNIKVGINIDIFPLDFVSYDKQKDNLDRDKVRISYQRIYANMAPFPSFFKIKTFIRSLYQILKMKAIHINALEELKKIDIFVNNKEYINSGYLFNSQFGYYKNARYKQEWISSYVDIEFEGKKYKVFSGYKNILRELYGDDFMQLPPIEKRTTHHSIAYIK